VVEIQIPPLHERREDIPPLVDYFLAEAAERFKRAPKPLAPEALHACVTHRWKGNVRELRSAVEQALLLSAGPELTPLDLLGTTNSATGPAPTSFRDAKERAVQGFERDFLLQALRRHGGNITKAAEEVGMYRQNFQQKMRELGISVDDAVKPGDA
jgi:DNA-binding NtrC family response regulator